ncbi:helix-turn-helix transcriptional regulator [Aggregatibacter actinomycetemcomitans]|uniref:helix-turn-helix domain-containing protein n=1 Tax=Aggregatibacter actinomycetemcomitans TaxID=714 RepID=UPI00197C2252|nr:helix-turn-helix transcriptional regulator [Aggregatibacter actinomycetemcomitans]MBN6068135.1 helix-turn-helix transcriptional regulator [Aggregatibacter actinomycetemcomitans]MBN6086011.1 helix-turn-helix transcriptional regulator [Aggregatibacter actinomycetemcomitans]
MKTDDQFIHPIRLIFAKNLRKIRRLKDISQEALALEAEISRAYISDIERGKRSLSIDVMGKLADALEVSIIDLLKYENALPTPNSPDMYQLNK